MGTEFCTNCGAPAAVVEGNVVFTPGLAKDEVDFSAAELREAVHELLTRATRLSTLTKDHTLFDEARMVDVACTNVRRLLEG